MLYLLFYVHAWALSLTMVVGRGFQFNDLVLLCSQRLISQRVGAGPPLRVRARLDMDGLIVEEGDNLETPNTFYIRNTGRSIELCTT